MQTQVGLRVCQRLASGDPNLLAHQIDAGTHLRQRMLDLQARLDFGEVEMPLLDRPEIRPCRRSRS